MAALNKPAPAKGRWTPARERRFLEHLAASSNVRAAERVAMVPPRSAYYRRAHDAAFRAAWEVALREGYMHLEMALLQRAIEGTPVIVADRQGKTKKSREYSERLGLNLLAQHREAVAATRAIDGEESARERFDRKLEEMGRRIGEAERDAAAGRGDGAGEDGCRGGADDR